MYWKKFVYLNYMEYGVRIKNVGHVKLFLHHDVLSLSVHLKGLHETDTLLVELTGLTRKKEITLGRICVDKGCCYFNGEYSADNIDGNGVRADELCGICIRLSEKRNVTASWEQVGEGKPDSGSGSGEDVLKTCNGPERMREKSPEQGPEKPRKPERPERLEKPEMECRAEPEAPEKRFWIEPEQTGREESQVPEPEKCTQETSGQQAAEETDKIYEDKWEQLCHSYSVVHPFGEEEYISLTPRDFVVLRQEYQQLVNNSFLLHGYYNYHHLILGKIKGDPKNGYYLGVPGTYYEREKMVAVMFGFEGFESAAERIEQGTFGYYMRRVQI